VSKAAAGVPAKFDCPGALPYGPGVPPARLPAWLLLGCLTLLAACSGGGSECGPARVPTPLDHAVTGRITGTVDFQGPVPAMTPLPLSGEPACAAQHSGPVPSGDALVEDGHVANAFVYIRDGLGGRTFATPTEPVTIDQRGCLYEPHVVGAETCQPIVFVNSDALLHNVHGSPTHSPAWNFAMGVQGGTRTVRVAEPEVMVDVRCDVHPWMRAYVGVLDHPYFAVTGADGRFTLADVPPGDYVIASWHERFGTREAKVTLGPRETTRTDLVYSAAR